MYIIKLTTKPVHVSIPLLKRTKDIQRSLSIVRLYLERNLKNTLQFDKSSYSWGLGLGGELFYYVNLCVLGILYYLHAF